MEITVRANTVITNRQVKIQQAAFIWDDQGIDSLREYYNLMHPYQIKQVLHVI